MTAPAAPAKCPACGQRGICAAGCSTRGYARKEITWSGAGDSTLTAPAGTFGVGDHITLHGVMPNGRTERFSVVRAEGSTITIRPAHRGRRLDPRRWARTYFGWNRRLIATLTASIVNILNTAPGALIPLAMVLSGFFVDGFAGWYLPGVGLALALTRWEANR